MFLFTAYVVSSMGHVRDIMGRNVVTMSDDVSVLDAARLLRERDISFVVVLANGRPSGILTERDIVRKVAAEDKLSSSMSVSSVCTDSFLWVDPSTTIEVAVQKMLNANIRRLVVLEDGRLVGVVTQTDLASHLRSRLLIQGTITKSGT